MQRLAAEMNLAETAFLEPRDGRYLLRWFTPVIEVALCGHATLASAHVLFETGLAAAGEPIELRLGQRAAGRPPGRRGDRAGLPGHAGRAGKRRRPACLTRSASARQSGPAGHRRISSWW